MKIIERSDDLLHVKLLQELLDFQKQMDQINLTGACQQ